MKRAPTDVASRSKWIKSRWILLSGRTVFTLIRAVPAGMSVMGSLLLPPTARFFSGGNSGRNVNGTELFVAGFPDLMKPELNWSLRMPGQRILAVGVCLGR